MKVTVVTDQHGNLVGTIRGHKLSEKQGNIEAGVFLSPGHTVRHIEVDDALGKLTDADEFHSRLTKHMTKC